MTWPDPRGAFLARLLHRLGGGGAGSSDGLHLPRVRRVRFLGAGVTNMIMYILQGLPGSGKSTKAQQIAYTTGPSAA